MVRRIAARAAKVVLEASVISLGALPGTQRIWSKKVDVSHRAEAISCLLNGAHLAIDKQDRSNDKWRNTQLM